MLTTLLIPTYIQMLKAVSAWLEKAQAEAGDAEALLSARLAPDMYPLSTQVRFVCLQAQEAVFRLKGEPLPDYLDHLGQEARNAGEKPGSLSDAQARISEALAFLEGQGPHVLDAAVNRSIVLQVPNGMIFDMTGEQYVRDWALPQFYFHLSTAYAILRNHKIELGKADLVSHMFQYLRPGTMPGA